MQRIKIESKLLKSVGYDPAKQILEVEFLSGKVYQYKDVPPEKALKMSLEKSKGAYFLTKIKPEHAFTRIEEKDEKESEEKNEGQAPPSPEAA